MREREGQHNRKTAKRGPFCIRTLDRLSGSLSRFFIFGLPGRAKRFITRREVPRAFDRRVPDVRNALIIGKKENREVPECHRRDQAGRPAQARRIIHLMR